jgi:phosphate uptake regulator
MPVRYAFRLRSTVAQLERVADHSTNIAEQVIYLRTGKTVRHLPDGWTSPTDPA